MALVVLAAEYILSPLRLMLGRHGHGHSARGIGNRIPRFPFFFLPGNGEGIPVSRFRRETGNPRFGVPIRRAGDFLVWARRWQGRGLDLPREHGPQAASGCGRAGACPATEWGPPITQIKPSRAPSESVCVSTVLSTCKRQLLLTKVRSGQVRFITRPKSRTMRAKRKKNVRELTERWCPNEQRARE
jgi:hypothetical protein